MTRKRIKRGESCGHSQKSGFSGINQHIKEGTRLLSPFDKNMPGLVLIDWARDLLPEHLWIAGLYDLHGDRMHTLYSEFLDRIDKYFTVDKAIHRGFISDFANVTEELKGNTVEILGDSLIYEAFIRPIGRILSFYPENPCSWLIRQDLLDIDGRIDPEVELTRLSCIVAKLIPGKDYFPGHVRAIPLKRYLKHNKVKICRDISVIELLPKYPADCTDEEQYRVQSFARSLINVSYMHETHLTKFEWSKYFWRHNLQLRVCRISELQTTKLQALDENRIEQLFGTIHKNIEAITEYVERTATTFEYDLYDTDKNEVILGLLARMIRLYTLFLENSNLWAGDISSILVRCFTDTWITFGYLAHAATNKELKQYIEHSRCKDKLLFLHLMERSQRLKFADTTEEELIAELGGGFMTEIQSVELSHWAKSNARTMAKSAKLEHIYKLVYDPTSMHVHSGWKSIRTFNLRYCSEPLHRYHRVPVLQSPLYILEPLISFENLFLEMLSYARDIIGTPKDNFDEFGYKRLSTIIA